ncbi:uncharacterized protein LOC135376492 [Ornithodoros turicata]|uniref:uncharacterized protein LOC135376492 n=1 Tax=Ornithodoros turicata TaxID=34597 RepID=UPI003138EF4D
MTSKGKNNFLIVKFPGENNDVAVVHASWVDGMFCWWPPEKNSNKLRTMVIKGQTPAQDWRRVECGVLDGFSSYEDARKKLPAAEQTSDLQSDAEPKRVRRKPSRLIHSSSSDSDSGQATLPPPPASDSTQGSQLCLSGSQHFGTTDLRQEFDPSVRHTFATLPRAFENEVLRLLHALRAVQEDHSTQLNDISSALQQRTSQMATEESDDTKPYAVLERFLDVDSSPNEESEMQKMVAMLQKYGGTNTRDATQRILRALMTDEVATSFSWQGGKGKMKFCDLLCCNAIFRIVMSKRLLKNATRSEVEHNIKSWLRHAKERHDRACK